MKAKPTPSFLLLLPLASFFQPFSKRDTHSLSSPHSRRDQTCPQQLPHTSRHVVFQEVPFFFDKRESHITRLSSRHLLRPQLLGFRSQVHSRRFHTRRQNNSFFLAAFLTSLLQTCAGGDCLALSFFPSVSDRQLQVLLLYPFFKFIKTISAISTNSLFLPFMKAVMSSTNTVNFRGG